jgi:putative FmdB family regulatory protein
MPIYEYQCKECGAVSEYLMHHSSTDQILCKTCGSTLMEKVLSPTAMLSKIPRRAPGKTCCGREERCATPPCSSGGGESCCKH